MVFLSGLTNQVHNVKVAIMVVENLFEWNAVFLGEESSHIKERIAVVLLCLSVQSVTLEDNLYQF